MTLLRLLLLGLLYAPAAWAGTVVPTTTYTGTTTVAGPDTIEIASGATVTVASTADVTYLATDSISLGPDFTASSGGSFSALIGTDTQAPSVPGSPATSAAGPTSLTFSWSAASDNVGVTSYQVSVGGVFYGTVTGTSILVTGLTPGSTYSFNVRARDAAGNWSGWSTGVNGTTTGGADTQAPSVPGSVTTSAPNPTYLTLAWSAASDNVGVTGYEVSVGGSPYATTPYTTLTVAGLTPSTSYSFSVRARDAAGNWSGWSSGVNGTTANKPVSDFAKAFWLDTNNDGILDRVSGSNTDAFHFWVNSWTTTNTSYATYNINGWFESWGSLYGDLGQPDFSWVWIPVWAFWTTSTTYFDVIFDVATDADRQTQIWRDRTALANPDVVNPGNWEYVLTVPSFSINTHQNAHLSINDPGEMDRTRYYAVQTGRPVGSVQLGLPGNATLKVATNGSFGGITLSGGTTITASGGSVTVSGSGTVSPGNSLTLSGGIVVQVDGSGNATITFSNGTAVTVSSTGTLGLTLPSGTPSILAQAADTAGTLLNVANNKVVFSVKNTLGQVISVPKNGLLDILNVGIDLSGQWQIGVKQGGQSDGQTVWIPVNVESAQHRIIKKVANGDIATIAWSSAVEQGLAQPLYAGTKNGDMVSWSLDDLLPGTYTWTATGPYFDDQVSLPQTIQGPSGNNVSEWKIVRGDDDSTHDWIDWRPGRYQIKCHVTPSWGNSFDVQYEQRIGWRTARYLVVGQVRPIADFVISQTQKDALKADIIADLGTRVLWLVNPISSTAATAIMTYVSLPSTPVEEVGKMWLGLRASPPKSVASLPHVGEDEKFWLAQELLNGSPDTVDLADLDPLPVQTLLNLFQLQSYRMLGEYEIKYLLREDGKIQDDSLVSVGSPSSLMGPTKMQITGFISVFANAGTLWVLPLIGLSGATDTANNLLIPSLENTRNGQQRKDITGGRVSLYTSGRIGWEASRGNYALFERDVPYIFNEIIFGLDASGRDNQNQVQLSINKTWNAAGTESGLIYFNEIRIYSRRNGSGAYDLLKKYSLNQQAGMLRPFIYHTPLGQFPTSEPAPTVQDTQ